MGSTAAVLAKREQQNCDWLTGVVTKPYSYICQNYKEIHLCPLKATCHPEIIHNYYKNQLNHTTSNQQNELTCHEATWQRDCRDSKWDGSAQGPCRMRANRLDTTTQTRLSVCQVRTWTDVSWSVQECLWSRCSPRHRASCLPVCQTAQCTELSATSDNGRSVTHEQTAAYFHTAEWHSEFNACKDNK